MAMVMNTAGVAKAYDRWAPVYDLVFGPVFRQGRAAAVKAADRIGGRILEVGVGIDLSPSMLGKARARVERFGLRNVEAVEVGDAEALTYPDASFDVVVAQYVVSAVPHPARALDEFARVCRPGGEIIVTTRVSSNKGVRGAIEKKLMPVTSRLGFRTDFPFSLYTDWIATRDDVSVAEQRPIPPFDHFSLVRIAKHAPMHQPTKGQA
jgi:phosphatidylethanolamine/phosphatidyl-N-methylethanolamine N-methyltransferase